MDNIVYLNHPEFTGRNVPITEIAKAIGKDAQYVRVGLQQGILKFGVAMKLDMPKEKIGDYLPPELRSRFSFKCAFWPLSDKEKNAYVEYKCKQYFEKIAKECPDIDQSNELSEIVSVDVTK